MVAMESPRKVSADGGGPAETERSKPPLPGKGQEPESSRARGSYRAGEGNHYQAVFSIKSATGPAATRGSHKHGEVPYSDSVRTHAGERWSVFGNGSGTGKRRAT